MRFHKAVEFPGSLEQVRELLDDPDFRDDVARAAGAGDVDVTVEEYDDGSVVVTTDSSQSTAQMPSIASKYLGGTLQIHQEEEWASPVSGTLTVTIPGQPGNVTGTLALQERGDATVQTVDAEIKVAIPLLGGRIEKLIGQLLGNALKLQARLAAERLDG